MKLFCGRRPDVAAVEADWTPPGAPTPVPAIVVEGVVRSPFVVEAAAAAVASAKDLVSCGIKPLQREGKLQ